VSSREVALSLVNTACRRPFGPTVPAPDTLGLETDMFIASVPGTTDKRVFLVGIEGKRLIPNKDVLVELKRLGISDKGEVSSDALNMFPTLPTP
jgi:hypothetical protein